MKSTEEIKDIIETILQGTDLFLVDLKVSPGKGFHSNGNRVGDKPLGLDMYGFKYWY